MAGEHALSIYAMSRRLIVAIRWIAAGDQARLLTREADLH